MPPTRKTAKATRNRSAQLHEKTKVDGHHHEVSTWIDANL